MLLSACGSAAPASPDLAEGVISGENVLNYSASFRTSLEDRAAADAKISECMAAEGFDYVADVPPPPQAYEQAMADPELPESSFAREWGFGISLGGYEVTAEEQNLSDEEIAELIERANAGVYDPFDDLPPEEAGAYLLTLEGEDGCRAEALQQQRDLGIAYDAKYEQIQAALQQFSQSDELREHYTEWGACMEARGFNYPSPLAIRLDLEARLRTVDIQGGSLADVEELRAFELDLAQSSVECGGTVRDLLPPAMTSVWLDYTEGL